MNCTHPSFIAKIFFSGNIVEWRLPEDVDLDGVEFKAMASGSHTLRTDFV
jgi:virulence-associated protein VagC